AVVAGELLQNAHRRQSVPRPLYQKIIGMKTGALFGLSLALPSILANDPLRPEIQELGNRLGSFYQMLDDFLDYCQWASSGKIPYTDYRSGVWTFVAAEIKGFSFGWEPKILQERLAENKCASLARALAVFQNEADFLVAKVRLYFGADSSLEAIVRGWLERAEKAFETEKSHFLLEDILIRRYPSGNEGAFFSRNSRSFSFASLFFPKRIREKITRLYAFCRITDDLADGEVGLEDAERSGVLETWRRLACRSHQGEQTFFPVLDAVMGDMREGKVPFRYAEELIAGALMDQRPRLYETRSDLALYTYRVASVVGQWITELSGCHDPETLVEAARLGHAMQMTNILRDVGEDLRLGRIYLPEDSLREFDLRSHYLRDFSTRPIHPVYASAIEALLRETEAEYERAFRAIPKLHPAFRIPVAMAAEIYRGIHDEIRKNGYDHFSLRARVGFFTKLKLASRALVKLYRVSRKTH
ncbi:MAG: squalene/phytoene synthase family protein, partial [Spirochaetia bacterium]|nr:squalene/phytoene synthase family protein [Spirochaetia bacterium]